MDEDDLFDTLIGSSFIITIANSIIDLFNKVIALLDNIN